MKKQLIFWMTGVFLVFGACVPTRKFNDLKTNYEDLQIENKGLAHKAKRATSRLKKSEAQYKELEDYQQDLEKAYDKLLGERDEIQQRYLKLEDSYQLLERNSSRFIRENANRNRKLLEEIEQKQLRLDQEGNRLDELTASLEKREARLTMLETAIRDRKDRIESLKNEVAEAFEEYGEGDAIEIRQRRSRIQVSVANEMLFDSTASALNSSGLRTMKKLGKALVNKPDIHVWIGGFFDYDQLMDLAFQPARELSIQRALSVVNTLKEDHALDADLISVGGWRVANPHEMTRENLNDGIQILITPDVGIQELAKELEED